MRTRLTVLFFLLALLLILPGQSQVATSPVPRNLITVDVTVPIAPPETGFLHLGGISSSGHSLQVNSRYLTLDGKPWLPVMGELHYTRIPEEAWEEEILKMKAAGINIIATYVFWIHHEEIEGQFDWTGRRNLRHFVELCAKHGMYVYLRPGPWAHGEARNGGFPDWLNVLPNVRTNDPIYLEHVSRFFIQIGQQLNGLMWKDGGPVIGAQLENEYPLHGPGRGTEHLLRLKQLAIAAGIDPPLFSVTGWPSLDFPPQEVLPVSGGYPDGFWFGSQSALPPSMNYLFNFNRELGDMGATVPSTDPTGKVDLKHDPYFAAEQAGGMATSYHRRPVLSADDIAALALVGIGSGVNLYGYYMFHGGTNPPGKRTSLQESQATGYPNDLPQIDYDFQAPIGAYGEIRESYRKTRLLHLFLNAYGDQLAPMSATGPSQRTPRSIEAAAQDSSSARVAVRTNGASGFAFVNNYVRQLAMPRRPGFQLSIHLASGELRIPRHPVDLPANTYLLWPFNMNIQRARLVYSTAQPLTRVETPQGLVAVFFAIPGIPPEFSFDRSTVRSIDSAGAHLAGNGAAWFIDQLKPGLNTTIHIVDIQGNTSTVLLLTQKQAEHCALMHTSNQDYLAYTDSDLFQDDDRLHLRSTASPDQQIRLLPEATLREAQGSAIQPAQTSLGRSIHGRQSDLWTRFAVSQPVRSFHAEVKAVRSVLPRATMRMGPAVAWRSGPVPQVPNDDAFQDAAVWQISVNTSSADTARNSTPVANLRGLSELFLRIQFTGDIAHIESGEKLIDDDFYNGLSWQIGLSNLGLVNSDSALKLAVLPMPSHSPIYLDEQARSLLQQHPVAQLLGASLIPQYESVLMLDLVH